MKIMQVIVKRRILAFLIAVVVLTSCAHDGTHGDAAIWIDVRTPAEYAGGHIENAVNIPYNEITERISEVTTNKARSIYLYCGSGRRAGIARKTLQDLGYTDVTNAGGYKDLLAHGK